jgi:alanine transaminase
MTFFRQVLALCIDPSLLQDALAGGKAAEIYPSDAISRADNIMNGTNGHGLGAYSHSKGVAHVRQTVANFIASRDGHECDPESIFLTNGASDGVIAVLDLLIRSDQDGVMIPIPQYPLYSAALTLKGGAAVNYYLDEEMGWGLSVAELERSVEDAKARGINCRALAVINPGNPTGGCLSLESMQGVVQFCEQENLVLLADEVYQQNVYVDDKPFNSFKKVVRDAGSNVELVSYHSTSKGYLGECGMRGGYMEAVNIDPEVLEEIYKVRSVTLCSNLTGQVMVDLMVNPPQPGDASHPLFAEERDAQLAKLKSRANKLVAALNGLEGVTCNAAEGAMYAFPQIRLPTKALEFAKAAGKAPDALYAMEMLEATGICVVPGSGFGQEEGTLHFRTTFLPGDEKIDQAVSMMQKFHAGFMKKYS